MEKKILSVMIVLIALSVLSTWFSPDSHEKNDPVGQIASNFVVKDFEGQEFSLQEVLGKKVILLNFWATWCPPCREEVPLLNELQKRFDKEKFVVLGLMEDDSDRLEDYQKAYNHFTEKIPIHFPVYVDEESRVANQFGTFLLPESYLIGLDGRIVHYQAGPIMKGDFQGYLQRIQELLL